VHSNVWLIGPVVSLLLGGILIGQGLWSYAQHNSVTRRELSKATIFGLRAVLVSSGLFLTVISASPRTWINKAMKNPGLCEFHGQIWLT
jgi:hypothetical protein